MLISYKINSGLFLGFLVVFVLPLTILIPNFSVFDYIWKIRITRFHFTKFDFTWPQINITMVFIILAFFTIFLEIRKRRLDELVMHVLEAEQITQDTLALDRERRNNALQGCAKLMDCSADHYEQLVLLQDDLRRRKEDKAKQAPPEIEPSSVINTAE